MPSVIKCMICGKPCRSVGHHVASAHGISARDYRDMLGLPRSQKLTSAEVRATFTAQAIANGIPSPDIVARLTRDASQNALKGALVKADLAAAGRKFGRAPTITDTIIRDIIAAAETGAHPYQVCREMGVSWSGFHGALKRSPRLLARYKSLLIRKGRSSDGGTVAARVRQALIESAAPMAMADLAEVISGHRKSSAVADAVAKLEATGDLAVAIGKQSRKILTWKGRP